MKTILKTSYLIIGGAIALSSCQQEQTPSGIPDDADRRIVFSSSFPELTTKALEITTNPPYLQMTVFDENDAELTNYMYAKDVRLDKNENSARYSSEECLWPEPGKETDMLHFFAYYPRLTDPEKMLVNNSSVSDGKASIGLQIKDYAIAQDIAEQVDFVTAYTTGNMAANLFSGINLKFSHQLCRVEVKVTGVHKSCNIEIAGVAIGSAPMQGSFVVPKSDDAQPTWTDVVKRNATYIFRQGDQIVTTSKDTVSIMGSKIDDANDNCAMLIPCKSSAWNYTADNRNAQKGLYLNVLLRVIDATNTLGKGEQRYPYTDNNQGLNSPNIPRVYLAVDNSGKVTANPGQLYRDADGTYFTDKEMSTSYVAPEGSKVKEFGWAAVPISGDWQPGKIYTYTLDYTYGVGVHGPETLGDVAPKAGDPIISDRVGVSMSVKGWQNAGNTGISVPGN